MSDILNYSQDKTVVAIDIAIKTHDACIQFAEGKVNANEN